MPLATIKSRPPSAAPGHDFLIPCESYLQAIRQSMGLIDLDPCSTPAAQALIEALGWFRLEDAAASLAVPWSGKVFLHPHRSPKLSRLQLHKLLRDYISDRVTEAIILITKTDWLRAEPLLFSFPFLFHYKRLKFYREVDQKLGGRPVLVPLTPSCLPVTLYLPAKDGSHFSDEKLERFRQAFSSHGRVILNEFTDDLWQQDAALAMARSHNQPFLTHPGIRRHGD
jgi:hypothetical protein